MNLYFCFRLMTDEINWYMQVGGARERANDDSVHTASPARDWRPDREGTVYPFSPWESTHRSMLLLPRCWCRFQGLLDYTLVSRYVYVNLFNLCWCGEMVRCVEGGGERCGSSERAGRQGMGPEGWLRARHWWHRCTHRKPR